MAKICGIYKITNKLDCRIYIGQSVDIKTRWSAHRCKNRASICYISNAIDAHGLDNFEFEIIEECDRDRLNDREIYWINLLNSLYPNGYNLTAGGSLYKVVSDETRRKLSIANKGRRISDESKEKMRIAKLGIRHSEETKNKLSLALKGRKKSLEHARKVAVSNTGRVVKESTKEKLSKINSKRVVRSDGIVFDSLGHAAKEIGMSVSSVNAVLKGRMRSANGYTFIYAD